MKKMSKYLLSALSVLGTMNLSALPSQAIGSMPAYGDMMISNANEEENLIQDIQDRYSEQAQRTNSYVGDGYVDNKAPLPEEDLEYADTEDENNIPEQGELDTRVNENQEYQGDGYIDEKAPLNEDRDQANGKDAKTNEESLETAAPDVKQEVSDEVAEKKETTGENSGNKNFINDEKPALPASAESNVEFENKSPVETKIPSVEDKENAAPVRTNSEPETKGTQSPNETKNADLPEAPKPGETNELNVNVADMKNLMSKKVVKSVVDYIPYVVAFAKAKEAYRYLEKERAFDLPHKAYRDLTLLPQYEEVKMFTTLLCDVFEVDTPSEEKMVANYKAKLPNLVVANKYLNNILDDLYDCKTAQKNGTYELKLKDLNFVNRLLISATSNDSDDSSTLPDEKENNNTVFAVNDEEKKVAKKVFGKKIGSTVSNDKNKDTCAKTMLRKIAKNV